MNNIAKAIGIVLVVLFAIAMCVLLVLSFFPSFHQWKAGWENDIKQPYIVQDAHGRIASYEWFYDMYEQIKATETKVKISSNQTEKEGIAMVLASMKAEYNSRARMQKTKALWKPSDLPSEIQ